MVIRALSLLLYKIPTKSSTSASEHGPVNWVQAVNRIVFEKKMTAATNLADSDQMQTRCSLKQPGRDHECHRRSGLQYECCANLTLDFKTVYFNHDACERQRAAQATIQELRW